MKRVKNSVRLIALAALLCWLLTMGVFAAENGSVWVAEEPIEGGTAAFITTDAAVTDGVVVVKYDAEKLTWQDVIVNDTRVAMYAVNADEAGTVKISWVAPGAVASDGYEFLFQVNFAGKSDEAITLEGEVTGGAVTAAPVVDKTELEKVVLEAEGLQEDAYTAESWAAMRKALAAAQEALADSLADQAEVDAAAEALRAALDALELAEGSTGDVDKAELEKTVGIADGLKKGNYTQASWKAMEKALKEAKAVLADDDATQAEVDAAAAALKAAIAGLKLSNTANTGDNADLTLPIIAVVVSAIAIVVILIIMKKNKKGGKD